MDRDVPGRGYEAHAGVRGEDRGVAVHVLGVDLLESLIRQQQCMLRFQGRGHSLSSRLRGHPVTMTLTVNFFPLYLVARREAE